MLDIEKDVELKKFTTFQIGGRADLLIKTKSRDELLEALRWAKQESVPFVVLGGGSNVLISDDGFRGLVIINRGGHFEISGNRLYAEGGAFTARLALESRKAGLFGLEFASGIPGTIAGAVVGNAGAYGQSISEFVNKVEVWDNGETKWLALEDLDFSYRSSIFKENKKFVILSVELLLLVEGESSEKDIQKDAAKRVSDYGGANAGSYFKNQETSHLTPEKASELTAFINHDKLAVGKLIESAGLKGRQIGGAEISSNHANVIVNVSDATAVDVDALEKEVRSKVLEKFGIDLEPEVVKIGETTK